MNMNMKIVFGFLLLARMSAGFPTETRDAKAQPTPKLNLWGTVGRKSFYGGDDIKNWDEARIECMEFGMNMVRFESQAEIEFVTEQIYGDSSKGPVWLGARSVSTADMYVWSEDYSITNPASDPIGTSVNLYYMAEAGKMALVFGPTGTSAYGVHSLESAAKALCQRVAI